MGLCKDCKHWARVDKVDGLPATHMGVCDSEKWFEGYRYEPNDIPPDGVLVENDEGWGFYAGEDFGCVHWEHTG